MTRENETTRAAQHTGARAGHANDLDVEAEHRPDVARRASLAGLRRHAATLPKRPDAEAAHEAGETRGIADTTVDERRAQGGLANESGSEAITTALRLGAKELMSGAHQIMELISAPTGAAGIDRQLRAVEQVFERASDLVDRLSRELGLVHNSNLREGEEVKRALSVFERAHLAFSVSVSKAQQHAKLDPQQYLNVATKPLQDKITRMFAERKWTVPEVTASVVGPGEMDHRLTDLQKDSSDQLLLQALAANAEATLDSARLVRMSLTSSSEAVLNSKLNRTIAHVSELAALLEQASSKAIKSHQPMLHKVVHELHGLQDEVAGKPALADRMDPGSAYDMSLRKISAKVGRR